MAARRSTKSTTPVEPVRTEITPETEITLALVLSDTVVVGDLLAEIAGRFTRNRLAGQSIVTQAAYLTFRMERDGLLYGDTSPGAVHPEGWLKTADYAARFGLRSAGNVSLWRTLGYVYGEIGMDPESWQARALRGASGVPAALKTMLCRNRDWSGKDGEPITRPAVPTVSEAEQMIALFYAEDGSKIAQRKGPGESVVSPGQATDTGAESTGSEPLPDRTTTPEIAARSALDMLVRACKDVPTAVWLEIDAVLVEMQDREGTVRQDEIAEIYRAQSEADAPAEQSA